MANEGEEEEGDVDENEGDRRTRSIFPTRLLWNKRPSKRPTGEVNSNPKSQSIFLSLPLSLVFVVVIVNRFGLLDLLSFSVRHSPTRAAALSHPFGARPRPSSPRCLPANVPFPPLSLSHSLSIGIEGDGRNGWMRCDLQIARGCDAYCIS